MRSTVLHLQRYLEVQLGLVDGAGTAGHTSGHGRRCQCAGLPSWTETGRGVPGVASLPALAIAMHKGSRTLVLPGYLSLRTIYVEVRGACPADVVCF